MWRSMDQSVDLKLGSLSSDSIPTASVLSPLATVTRTRCPISISEALQLLPSQIKVASSASLCETKCPFRFFIDRVVPSKAETTPSTVCNEGSQLRTGGRLGLAAALFLLASSNLDNGEFPSSNAG